MNHRRGLRSFSSTSPSSSFSPSPSPPELPSPSESCRPILGRFSPTSDSDCLVPFTPWSYRSFAYSARTVVSAIVSPVRKAAVRQAFRMESTFSSSLAMEVFGILEKGRPYEASTGLLAGEKK